MKAQELRIGNWYLGNGEYPEQITAKDILELNDDPQDDYYEPMPLTEEWLVKFGFKPFSKDWQKKGLIIHTRQRGYVVKKSMPILHHVHQLQNLYFALTGEELEMK